MIGNKLDECQNEGGMNVQADIRDAEQENGGECWRSWHAEKDKTLLEPKDEQSIMFGCVSSMLVGESSTEQEHGINQIYFTLSSLKKQK